MRVLVDGRVIQDRYHGIGRYTLELLRALPAAGDVEWIVLTVPAGGRLSAAELSRRPDIRLVPGPGPVVSAVAQARWPAILRRLRPDVLFAPYHLAAPWLPGRVPVLAVVHDCIFETDPAFAPDRATRRLYRLATRLALTRASAVATVSHASRTDLARFYGIRIGPGAVVPPAVGTRYRVGAGDRPGDLPERYVLHVGVRRPHKDQATLVEALYLLRERGTDVSLVLVGDRDERFPDPVPALVAGRGLQRHVTWYPRVSEARLIELYRHAELVAVPSLIEGFGLPVLEAMAAGAPVVASDAPAVVEAGRGAALVVPRGDPPAWCHAIDRVLRDRVLAEDLRRRGRAAAAHTSWAGSAAVAVDLLRALARGSRQEVRA
jgi:glycosyltransferase involved in cell wall biosynthesis